MKATEVAPRRRPRSESRVLGGNAPGQRRQQVRRICIGPQKNPHREHRGRLDGRRQHHGRRYCKATAGRRGRRPDDVRKEINPRSRDPGRENRARSNHGTRFGCNRCNDYVRNPLLSIPSTGEYHRGGSQGDRLGQDEDLRDDQPESLARRVVSASHPIRIELRVRRSGLAPTAASQPFARDL
jgi:hypothetical protein